MIAHLDAAAGIECEGETLPALSNADVFAFRVAALLKTGTGGIDWAGLPLVADWLGIDDLDGLMHRLETIVTHRPKTD